MKTTQLVPSYEDVKNSVTWVGGPTGKLQRQHIPGYSGFVPKIHAENLHSKTFAKTTAESLNNRNEEQMFKTNYHVEFKKPNLRNNAMQDTAKNILNDVQKNCDIQYQKNMVKYNNEPKTIEDIPPIDRVNIIGYKGFVPVYKYPLKTVTAPEVPQRVDVNTLNNKQLNSIIQKQEKGLPITGYTGFQQKVKSDNIYGVTFQDQTIQSEN